MKYHSLTLLLTVLMCMAFLNISAHDFEVDEIYYIFNDGSSGSSVSVSYRGSSSGLHGNYKGNVTIPNAVTYQGKTYDVTNIGSYAFRGCSNLTSITIPESVTSIGSFAFYDCSGLTSITIPESVTSIGNSAFYNTAWYNNQTYGLVYAGKVAYYYKGGMPNGTNIVLHEGTKGIASSCFEYCSGLTSITIPEGVTNIGSSAFRGCSNLTSITIPDSVTSIESETFLGCSVLTSINIPESVTSIGSSAFSGCNGLTSITIPDSVTSIESETFRNCSGLTSINIPERVNSIGSDAFYGCKSLTKVIIPNIAAWCQASISSNPLAYAHHIYCDDSTEIKNLIIPDSVTTIVSNTFSGCTGLISVIIPNGVTTIDRNAFYNTNLKSVYMGSGVLSIGKDVFAYDSSSSGSKPVKVIWLTNTPPDGYQYAAGTVNYVANDLYTQLTNKTVYPFLSSVFEVDGVKYVPVSPSERTCDVIDCSYDKDLTTINISETVVNKGITLNVKQIHPYACYEYSDIQSLTISNQGNVGDYAFKGCKGLQTVIVSNQGNVGIYAFHGSKGIKTISISNQGIIGQYAFYQCDSLQELKISNKGDIGQYAFAMVYGSFDATVKNEGYIGRNAFFQSTGLKRMEIGDLVTKIEQSAFQGCRNLKTATIGEGISSIGASAFYGCSQLQGIVIPDSVTTMEQEAFRGCSLMQSVKMGKGLSAINTSTFQGCSSLTDLQIGESVQTIGNFAFNGCSTLPSVRIPQAVKTVNDYAFQGCTSLKEVVMDEVVKGSSEEKDLQLGSNGSSPLFADCPLDSVFIGRNISYSTESNQGYSPFYRNTSLRSVFITDKETEISPNEFYGCAKLKNVRIGDGVTSIGDWAFSGCANLDYFAFGSSVKNIGKEAFSDCTAMTSIRSRAVEPPTCGNQALDDINKWECTLSVPVGFVPVYQAADQWKEFFFIEEGDLVTVPVTDIALNQDSVILNVKDSVMLEVTISPQKATNKNLQWSSSDTSIAMVDDHGIVFAQKAGVAVITAQSESQPDVSAVCYVTVLQPVEGIRLDKTELQLAAFGDSIQLIATVLPEDASDKNLHWTSSDESVATVDSLGVVTSKNIGTAIITVQSVSQPEVIATCNVEVVKIVESIILDETAISMSIGTTRQLTATALPDDAADKQLRWFSSDESVATVSDQGLVSAKKKGTAVITAQSIIVPSVEASCEITVYQPVESLDIEEDYLQIEQIGGKYQLTAHVFPEDADNQSIVWSSSDESVCTVSETGLVTGVHAGEAFIIATSVDGAKSDSCIVVVFVPVQELQLNVYSLMMTVGDSTQLQVTIYPEDATDKALLWESSDENVVTVDQTGLVRAVNEGTSTITVTAIAQNKAFVTCEAIVTKEDGIITLNMVNLPNVFAIYDSSGRKLNKLQRGMNVLLMKDGSQRKVLVK